MCPNCGAPQEKQPASEKKDVAGNQYSLGKLILACFLGGFIYFLLTNDDSNTSSTYFVDPDLTPQQQQDAMRAYMREQDKSELERNRAGITSEIKYLIANGEYATAYRRAARFSKLNDDELKGLELEAWEKHRRPQEKLLLAKLKHIPASEYKANADEYAKLVELFPENERYKKKRDHYRWKLGEQNKKSSSTTTKVNVANDIKQEIIQRCKSQMGDYGAAIVKACVDQDIEALVALYKYPEKYVLIIGRCLSQMKEYGYAKVKACADQEIEAEEALSN